MADIPNFINRDPDAIMAEVTAEFESKLGRPLQSGQFEQLVAQIISYFEVLLLERFNAGMAQLLVQFSNAPILDYIAALVAVERLPAANAGCTVKFNLVSGHGSVVLPIGTRVASQDGQHIFEVVDDITIAAGEVEVETLVTAQIAGKSANGIPIGGINTILDPIAWISSVENTEPTSGGSDVETDEQLRERIKLAPSQFSVAGPRQAYMFFAKSANPSIIDVSVADANETGQPGVVTIVPLCEDGNYTQVIQDIENVCNAENIRPLNDKLDVKPPSEVHYNLEVDLTLFTGSNSNDVESKVIMALEDFTDAKSKRLGLDIVRSAIVQVCRLPEVYDVKIVSPSFATGNIIIDFNEVPICDSISVNVIGFNNG